MCFTFVFSLRQNREDIWVEVVMKKKKIKKLIKKYESELWKCRYKESALRVIKNNLSTSGYQDLGYYEGRALLYESIIDDLEKLLD